ncbi:extensin-1-like [Aricia agestis]|uniref:extensin-1-like n=1 Tax=Aricia agestis TaxID=91739 RepID=UPI001C2075A6|nr:extensin-1-like [Aricia agestis]
MHLYSTTSRTASLNRFDPKYASFGPRAPRPRPPAPPPALATFSPEPAPPRQDKYQQDKYPPPSDKYPPPSDKYPPPADKYATVRPARRADPQPLSAAALEYRSLQRPRRHQQPANHRRRPDRPDRPERQERPDRTDRNDRHDLYAVTEL